MFCEKERWWHQLKYSCSRTSNQCQSKHQNQKFIHFHSSAGLIAAQWLKQRQNPSLRLQNVPYCTWHMDLLRAVTRKEKKWIWTREGSSRQYIPLVLKYPEGHLQIISCIQSQNYRAELLHNHFIVDLKPKSLKPHIQGHIVVLSQIWWWPALSHCHWNLYVFQIT